MCVIIKIPLRGMEVRTERRWKYYEYGNLKMLTYVNILRPQQKHIAPRHGLGSGAARQMLCQAGKYIGFAHARHPPAQRGAILAHAPRQVKRF